MAAKPVVLPDTYDGEGSWDDWICHFENVADVNDWDDAAKLKFLKVRLVGKAQRAFLWWPRSIIRTRAELGIRFGPSIRIRNGTGPDPIREGHSELRPNYGSDPEQIRTGHTDPKRNRAGVTGNSVARKFCRRETESPKEKVSLSVNYVAKRHSYS